jgi:hypothetical protein
MRQENDAMAQILRSSITFLVAGFAVAVLISLAMGYRIN